MPAVTPAEVQTGPSHTKIGSGSTRTAGKRWASLAQYIQWVAARRPSSTPAAASRNAPVQTEATRRAGTLEEDDQVAGDGERHGAAEVFFHERQSQIDPGSHPCRGPNRTVTHENRIGL